MVDVADGAHVQVGLAGGVVRGGGRLGAGARARGAQGPEGGRACDSEKGAGKKEKGKSGATSRDAIKIEQSGCY